MTHREDAFFDIARRSLEPLLMELAQAVDDLEPPPEVVERVLAVAAEIYVTGHRDGLRDATAQIAVPASERGLHLRLAPDLEEPSPGPPGPRADSVGVG